MTTYFGFALADSMFAGDVEINRRVLNPEAVRARAATFVSCLNPSHVATIEAMHSAYGIAVAIPETPPRVKLGISDSVVVMGVHGLPRLTDRHEYSKEEIALCAFTFTEYTVREVYLGIKHPFVKLK
jgi:hypothetical protein